MSRRRLRVMPGPRPRFGRRAARARGGARGQHSAAHPPEEGCPPRATRVWRARRPVNGRVGHKRGFSFLSLGCRYIFASSRVSWGGNPPLAIEPAGTTRHWGSGSSRFRERVGRLPGARRGRCACAAPSSAGAANGRGGERKEGGHGRGVAGGRTGTPAGRPTAAVGPGGHRPTLRREPSEHAESAIHWLVARLHS